jgi:glycosyltransferase involved in cell wall biosynthesis
VHACTIAARNYLAQVRVLAESFKTFHPDDPFTVLVVDGEPGETYDPAAPYRPLCPTEVGFTRAELHELALIYDITELSTAVKPTFLKHLLDEGDQDVVAFFDPDMAFYDEVKEIEPLARAHGIVLVPHVLQPMPRDGAMPNEQTILLAGMFNLGFIAVGPQSVQFLQWWDERTRIECCSDVGAGMFTDQRWIDFVPSLFDHTVWRDPGFNVAYWNLHEREITRSSDGKPLANGTPLRVMHFSGYDIENPHLLSKHQGPKPRVLLSQKPVLADLTADYDRGVRQFGIEQWRQVPYRFGSIAGAPVPLQIRRFARSTLLPGSPDTPPPSPFEPDGEAAFIRWLNEPRARRGDDVVTRLLLHVWGQRPDLQAAFPHPTLDDLGALTTWATTAPDFLDCYGHLYDPPILPVGRGSSDTNAPPGLNIVGYLRAELGVGEAGRLMALAADAAGLPHQVIPYRATRSRQLDPFSARRPVPTPAVPYRVNLLCVNADSTPFLLGELPPEVLAGRYRIGLWFWEVDRPTHEIEGALDLVDEIWVTSEHIADVIRPLTDKPVLVTPLAIPPPVTTRLKRCDLDLPDDCHVFLTSFDAFSIPARKNPDAAVRAYQRAFGPDDGTYLLVKAINGDSSPVAMEHLRFLAGDRPDIEVRDGYVSRPEMSALVQLCDTVVSLHRSEGFGLVPAAAMAAGKPVIATGYSGNLAYMSDANTFLVPYQLVDVGPGRQPYPADAQWAEPNLDAAATFMRHVVDEPEAARIVGERARLDVARTHGLEVAGDWITRRLNQILRNEHPTTGLNRSVGTGEHALSTRSVT